MTRTRWNSGFPTAEAGDRRVGAGLLQRRAPARTEHHLLDGRDHRDAAAAAGGVRGAVPREHGLASRPRLWKTLDTGVPAAAQFERSDELDRMLSTNTDKGGWQVKAFAPKDGSVLILSARGKDAG